MILTAKHLESIRKSVEKVDYGKVIIMIDKEKKFIDIITEQRERIEKECLTEHITRRNQW
jgi:hypothetical protein